MTDQLNAIIAKKREEIAALNAREFAPMIADLPPPRGFTDALKKAAASGYGLIAEFKRASPSRGVINADADPESVAMSYEAGGATCLSVLTDAAFFHGSIADMVAAKGATLLPILRKDFIIDPVQIAEARAYGGDAILLILSALSDTQAHELEDCARFHGLDVLIETHDAEEVARALALTAPMIGVNNRNLRSMTTDLAVGEALLAQIPSSRLAIAESGLQTSDDLAQMARAGARCFLVGESLMCQDDIAMATSALLSNPLPPNWKEQHS